MNQTLGDSWQSSIEDQSARGRYARLILKQIVLEIKYLKDQEEARMEQFENDTYSLNYYQQKWYNFFLARHPEIYYGKPN